MKKIIPILICSLLCLPLVSCGLERTNSYTDTGHTKWVCDNPYIRIDYNQDEESALAIEVDQDTILTQELKDKLYGDSEIMYQGNLEYCEFCFMGDGYYVSLDLIDADCEYNGDVVFSTYVDGVGEIEKVEGEDYQYIMTFTVTGAYDMTNWKDGNQYLDDNEDLDADNYPKPFTEAVFYGTTY